MGIRGLAQSATATIATRAMERIEHPLLSQREYMLFARHGARRSLQAGEILFQPGDAGASMFVVVIGRVELQFDPEMPARSLGPNEFFGELGLLADNHRRTAEARAATDVALLEFSYDDFHRLVDKDPGMAVFFLRRAMMRVTSSEQELVGQLRRRNRELETALANLYTTTDQLNHTEELVRTDDLTGLHNRRGLTVYLQECHRNSTMPQGLLLIDCDDFKRINDQHGHLAGDRVLQAVGKILHAVSGDRDLACRLGGDEFGVLIAHADAAALAEKASFILDAVQRLLATVADAPRICPVSIGACVIAEGYHWNDAYSRADTALYEAKRRGGNQVCWPGPSTACA